MASLEGCGNGVVEEFDLSLGETVYLVASGLGTAEAEHFQGYVADTASPTHEWVSATSPGSGALSGASGGTFMQATPDDATAHAGYEPPNLAFHFRVASAGTYTVYVRAAGVSTGSDSVRVRLSHMGGAEIALRHSVQTTNDGTWGWATHTDLDQSLAAGDYTVELSMRESGVSVDKVVLQLTSGGAPTGTGPAESGLLAHEACDDGNLEAGDGCDATCDVTPLDLLDARRLAMAAREDGSVLVTWVELVAGTETVEDTLAVRAVRYSVDGVPLDAMPLVLEEGIGVGERLAPAVAGVDGGWVVAWRSPTVEGADAELGGIAFRLVATDGALGARRQANVEERLDQRDPTVARARTGFVVGWTDLSDRVEDPFASVRARVFGPTGAPTSAELVVPATVDGDESQVVAATLEDGATLAFAWTHATIGIPSTVPRVHVRRFSVPMALGGLTPLDSVDLEVGAGWAFDASIAATDDTWWVAFTDRAADTGGDLTVVDIADDGSIGDDFTVAATGVAESAPAITATAAGPVYGWHTDAVPAGVDVDASGPMLPASFAAIADDLRGHREADVAVLATDVGLWLGWTDEGIDGSTQAVRLYLLPWEP